MNLAAAFSEIALGFSDMAGAPFHDAEIITTSPPILDDGGDIVTPGAVTRRPCKAQADYAGEAMRAQAGFAEGDIRILVLTAGFDVAITTDDSIEISTGPFSGLWSIESVGRDPANIGFELRGRRG